MKWDDGVAGDTWTTAAAGAAHSLYLIVYSVSISGAGDTVVGAQETVSSGVSPSDLTWTTQWTIGGTTVKSYVTAADASSAVATKLAGGDLSNNSVSFYWIDGGTGINVSCNVTVSGATGSASASVNVAKPSYSFGSQTTAHNTPVWIGNAWGDGNALAFGSFASPGITWTGNATFLAGNYQGKIALVQLVNYTAYWIDADGNHSKSSNGFELDTTFPYADPVPIVNNTASVTSDDTPNNPLGGASYVSADDSFKTYLMFQPQDGIWITLSEISWGWGGAAEDVGGFWTLEDPWWSTNPSSQSTTELPQWTHVFPN